MAKVKIKSEKITKVRRNISLKDIFFHIILHFGLLTIGISCYVGDLLAQKRKGAPSIAPSPSLLSNINSKTSHIPILILQLIIQLLGDMIIGIGICKPLIKGAVVVHLRFLLSKRLHHAPLFYFRKHQVHAGGKG